MTVTNIATTTQNTISVVHPVRTDPPPSKPTVVLFSPGSTSEGSGPTTGQISPRP